MEQKLSLKVLANVKLEYVLVILALAIGTWLFYHFFLKKLSEDRHKLFEKDFYSLATSLFIGLGLFGIHEAILTYSFLSSIANDLAPYTGFMCIFMGCICLIKNFRIIAYEYFFFNSMKAGVPVLLFNIFTLIFSGFLGGWVLTAIFDVQIASVLTTSAVLTIVLGLALQDTLGNLVAGISLQIDKPFELDDWIELRNGNEKVSGQVKELTWRATILLALTDEFITIPNRMIAQWQIVNYSARTQPFYRAHTFRLKFGTPIEIAKEVFLQAILEIPTILKYPKPAVVITETTDSWISLRVVYAINNYGAQYDISDHFHDRALTLLTQNNIELAQQQMQVSLREPS